MNISRDLHHNSSHFSRKKLANGSKTQNGKSSDQLDGATKSNKYFYLQQFLNQYTKSKKSREAVSLDNSDKKHRNRTITHTLPTQTLLKPPQIIFPGAPLTRLITSPSTVTSPIRNPPNGTKTPAESTTGLVVVCGAPTDLAMDALPSTLPGKNYAQTFVVPRGAGKDRGDDHENILLDFKRDSNDSINGGAFSFETVRNTTQAKHIGD